MTIIRPEILADKFRAAANGEAYQFAGDLRENPRLREALWGLQGNSLLEGGLEKFIASRVPGCLPSFGTKTMLALKDKRSYAAYERDAILREIPNYGRGKMLRPCNEPEQWLDEHLWSALDSKTRDHFDDQSPLMDSRRRVPASLNHAFFQTLCAEFAFRFLPQEIIRVCAQKDAQISPQWFCPDPTAAILQMLDAQAAEEARSVAQTQIVKFIYDALDFAFERKAFVRIDGNSRYGKSESVRARCAGRPGLMRKVNTHFMNSESDFFQSIAEPLGMEFDYKTSARELRLRIEHVMRYSGLMLIFDEAHFLIPSNISRIRRPMRLDWLRTQLVDRRCPIVIVTTPQEFNGQVAKLRKLTGYNFDQWDGRLSRNFRLQQTISPADALLVVRHKAPDFPPSLQEMIEAAASLAGNYLAAVQSIVDAARWNAERAGRKTPLLPDIEQAIAEVVPDAALRSSAPLNPEISSGKRNETPAVAAARSVTSIPDVPIPARGNKPALRTVETH